MSGEGPDVGALRCLFCGEPEVAEILEVWSDHTFMIDTCCPGMHDAMVREMSRDADHSVGRSGAPHLRSVIAEAVGERPRRLIQHQGGLLIDYALHLRPVSLKAAKRFVEMHHAHCPPPAGWKFGIAIANGPGTVVGVAMIGRPVARMLDQLGTTLEVNRLCLDRTLPEGLRWNACSQLYAAAAKKARALGYQHLVTYIRDDEPGTSLIAAGWTRERVSVGGSRGRKNRRRAGHNEGPKIRWGKILRTCHESSPRHPAQHLEQSRMVISTNDATNPPLRS